jgi:hypothetical protein
LIFGKFLLSLLFSLCAELIVSYYFSPNGEMVFLFIHVEDKIA